jgi:subfamily B ATP-binding cassette protein MsbA
LVWRTRRHSKKAREALAANVGVMEQITSGIKVIKTFGSAEREQQRYAEANRKLEADNMRLARTRAQSDGITAGAVFVIAGAALIVAGWLFTRTAIAPAHLFVAIGALARLITSVREVVRAWGDLQEHLPSAERVHALLDRQSAVVDRPGARDCPLPRAAIRCEGVRFAYPPGVDEVLRGLDLEIPIGRTTALVGETGSGKSTLLDLLPRLHDVTGGRIAIDGVDVRDLRHDSLIRHFAIVGQDAFLFDDTVLANIAYGRPGATGAEVEAAARRAHVHDAILALEGGQGYATPVGDRGGRLSGGQRQRIAIARAFLRDAPIILLDEPTSALDADSERHVQAALAELMRDRTVVIVAHRLATVQHADRIHVLAGKDHPARGTVLESGSHGELIARGGAYARLVGMQQLRV